GGPAGAIPECPGGPDGPGSDRSSTAPGNGGTGAGARAARSTQRNQVQAGVAQTAGGTGLGLAIVQRLCDLLGGTVTAIRVGARLSLHRRGSTRAAPGGTGSVARAGSPRQRSSRFHRTLAMKPPSSTSSQDAS